MQTTQEKNYGLPAPNLSIYTLNKDLCGKLIEHSVLGSYSCLNESLSLHFLLQKECAKYTNHAFYIG